jgi:formylglycine-generating enzyme required for sulfatase activity
MEPLRGAQRLVLQAVHDLQGDTTTYVEDGAVAQQARIDLDDVRNCFAALEERGYLNVAPLINGRSAFITADGRLALKQGVVASGGRAAHHREVAVRPKGMLAFDQRDADFFLQLLPGPRGEGGLPDSLLYWKSRIEEGDAEQTFRVGVIYGPSGCGKSSLVKAGLLPRLARHVLAVYVEATADDTEARLRKGLYKGFPDLPAELGLAEAVEALLNTATALAGNKALLVIDQFEQWLTARQAEENAELVTALSKCDGVRLQAIVMVRDDFSMALFRFLRQLGVELQQSRNLSVVDLFGLRHARGVLVAFGQAFGALPADEGAMTEAQRGFVDRAISELSRDGHVVAVRLALFAEMVRRREWSPRLLKEVGGTEGVGTAFLEQTFNSRQANPAHRIHQRAAQAVLKALLPEGGTDLKGNMQSQAKLLEVSGYARRPGDFEELLRILDGELRLITPTEPTGIDSETGDGQVTTAERHYQLTHDYLVHSLRDWLTRKQRETRRGRAELRLAERAADWDARPENRHLPAWWEWVNIRLWTRQKDWTPPQRKMMRRATRIHAARGLAVALALLAVTLAGLRIQGHYDEEKSTTHASGLVRQVLDAEIAEVPGIIDEMEAYRRWTDPRLRDAYADAEAHHEARKQLRASLALLPADPCQVEYLYGRLFDVEPQEVRFVRDALARYRQQLLDRLWAVVKQPGKGQEQQRLHAACALATYDPDNAHWEAVSGPVVEQLVAVNPNVLGFWMDNLRPVKDQFLDPLTTVFQDRKVERTGERTLAASILADYAAGQADRLAGLLLDADEKQFAIIYPKFQEQGERGLPVLIGVIGQELPSDPPFSDEKRERLAKRQANAAVALLKMNQEEKVWPLLNRSGQPDDPRVRSYLIHLLSPLGADARVLIRRLNEKDEKTDRPIRRALLLSLGEFDEKALPPADLQELRTWLETLYRENPDPGLHGAAEWLLFRWGRQDQLRDFNEKWREDPAKGEERCKEVRASREARLDWIRQELAKDKAPPQWYVNGQGQTMVVIPGPAEFQMGSPPTEVGREGGREGKLEQRHKKRIMHSFAIAAREVTVEQFLRFRKDHIYLEDYSPTPDCPGNSVSWYDAAAYCNWLSEQEGIPPDQWCYETKAGKDVRDWSRAGRTHQTTQAIGALGLASPGAPANLVPQAAITLRFATLDAFALWSREAYGEGMRLKENYLSLEGYRLPSEAEWEYACRARALTSRYYGETEELLGKYAWYTCSAKLQGMLPGSPDRPGVRAWRTHQTTQAIGALGLASPGAPANLVPQAAITLRFATLDAFALGVRGNCLKPNDFGLFDMLGNALEWCQESFTLYTPGAEDNPSEDREDKEPITNERRRVMRGGSFHLPMSSLRSASRTPFVPSNPTNSGGFRVTRTFR